MQDMTLNHPFNILLLILVLWAPACLAELDDSELDYSEMDLDELMTQDVYVASVFTAHLHRKNEWMFSYDVSHMRMEDNGNGSDNVSVAQMLDSNGLNYSIAPVKMHMDMEMFHIMYAQSDELTWIVMLQYLHSEMEHVTNSGTFTTEARGWSDTHLKMNLTFYQDSVSHIEHKLMATLGLSLPTGAIDKKDVTPMSGTTKVQLPYPMQLGSGTYDPMLGLSYMGVGDKWYWGAQGIATLHPFGNNANGYRLGNKLAFKSWLNHGVNENVMLFARLDINAQGNIRGEDKNLPAAMKTLVPTADSKLRAYKEARWVLGADYVFSVPLLAGQRIFTEVSKPFYQNLDGPQLKKDVTYHVGWLWVF